MWTIKYFRLLLLYSLLKSTIERDWNDFRQFLFVSVHTDCYD